MNDYSAALETWLLTGKQADLAEAIGKTQPSVSRYAAGQNLPEAATAREIDKHTAGAVPYSLWQAEKLKQLGMDKAA